MDTEDRENNGHQRQDGLIETVELGDEDHRHDEQCRNGRLGQKLSRFLLVFIRTAEFEGHALGPVLRLNPVVDLSHLGIYGCSIALVDGRLDAHGVEAILAARWKTLYVGLPP